MNRVLITMKHISISSIALTTEMADFIGVPICAQQGYGMDDQAILLGVVLIRPQKA